jgi:hypothetical protein
MKNLVRALVGALALSASATSWADGLPLFVPGSEISLDQAKDQLTERQFKGAQKEPTPGAPPQRVRIMKVNWGALHANAKSITVDGEEFRIIPPSTGPYCGEGQPGALCQWRGLNIQRERLELYWDHDKQAKGSGGLRGEIRRRSSITHIGPTIDGTAAVVVEWAAQDDGTPHVEHLNDTPRDPPKGDRPPKTPEPPVQRPTAPPPASRAASTVSLLYRVGYPIALSGDVITDFLGRPRVWALLQLPTKGEQE